MTTSDDQKPKDTTEADISAGVSCAAAAGYVGTEVQETAAEREARIYADVFNPNESDYEYFLRRKRELGM